MNVQNQSCLGYKLRKLYWRACIFRGGGVILVVGLGEWVTAIHHNIYPCVNDQDDAKLMAALDEFTKKFQNWDKDNIHPWNWEKQAMKQDPSR